MVAAIILTVISPRVRQGTTFVGVIVRSAPASGDDKAPGIGAIGA